MKRCLFVSSGEVSGDHYIATVARKMRELGWDGEIAGLCGEESIAAGAQSLWRAERLQLLGISEILGSLFDILSLKREMTREIISRDPAALLLVDSPDFNMPLARSLRRGGYRGKIFYISPPSVWAWRSYRTRALARDMDVLFPLFGFEHDYLVGAGCDSLWIGHPFLDEFKGLVPDRAAVAASMSSPLPDGEPIIALMPGSRASEISRLYPVLSAICPAIRDAGRLPLFSIAPGLSPDAAKSLRARLEADGHLYTSAPGRDLMAISEAIVGSSGTATAQALLLRKFMVVMYRLSPLSAMIGRLVLRNQFFAVPNLLAGEMFFPELIQQDAVPKRASAALLEIIGRDEERKRADLARMDRLAALMGREGVIGFWAEHLLEAVS